MPLTEVPQIVTKSKYPARDPNLKDNWRGRPRQDLSNIDDQIIQVIIKIETIISKIDCCINDHNLILTLKDKYSCILGVIILLCNNPVALLIRSPDKRGY